MKTKKTRKEKKRTCVEFVLINRNSNKRLSQTFFQEEESFCFFAILFVLLQRRLLYNGFKRIILNTTPVSEGVSKIVIKAKDIGKDCQYFDVLADNATAQKGEPGFWLCNRGLLGYFNKDNGGYTNPKQYIYLPYFAMKNPRETFIAIVDGMRFEFTVIIEVKNGKYVIFPALIRMKT